MNKTLSLGHGAAFLTVFIWGITLISKKILLDEFKPIEILFFRFVMAYMALWLCYPKWLHRKNWSEELLFVAAGFLGICMYYLLENIALIRVAADGASYEIVADEAVRPTSELPAHLSIHDYLVGAGRPERAVVHTHPIELIAMTHNPAFLDKDVLTRLLWSMIPETRAFCPKGLGIVPYTLPGSQLLADRTIELLDEYDVVMWTKHGALAVGTDLIEAFDQIDVLSKSARIYESARSMGFVPTGMSDAEMQELKEAFGL